ncbi:hypothetical protein ACOME3_006270 [Neoechinorhynchus agilis]
MMIMVLVLLIFLGLRVVSSTTINIPMKKYIHVGLYDAPYTFELKNLTDYILSIVHFNGTIVYAREIFTRESVKDRLSFTNRTMEISALDNNYIGLYTLMYTSQNRTNPIYEAELVLAAIEDQENTSSIKNDSAIYETRTINGQYVRDPRHRAPSCQFNVLTTNTTYGMIEDFLKIGWQIDNEDIEDETTVANFDNYSQKLSIESRLHKHWSRSDHGKSLVCSLLEKINETTIASVSSSLKLRYGPELEQGEDDVSVISNYSGQPMLLKCGIIAYPEPLITWSRTDDDTADESMQIIGTGRYYKFQRSTSGTFNISCRGSANGQTYEQKFTIHLTTNVRSLTENNVGFRRAASLIAGSMLGAVIFLILISILICIHRRNRWARMSTCYSDHFGGKLLKGRKCFNHKTLIANSTSVIGLNGHVEFVDPVRPNEEQNGFLNGSATIPRSMSDYPNGRGTLIHVERANRSTIDRSEIRVPSPPPYSSLGNLYNHNIGEHKNNSISRSSYDYKNAPGSRQPLRLPSISATDHATMLGMSRMSHSVSNGTYIEEKPTHV